MVGTKLDADFDNDTSIIVFDNSEFDTDSLIAFNNQINGFDNVITMTITSGFYKHKNFK